jgi:uncharacterized membrane protein
LAIVAALGVAVSAGGYAGYGGHGYGGHVGYVAPVVKHVDYYVRKLAY